MVYKNCYKLMPYMIYNPITGYTESLSVIKRAKVHFFTIYYSKKFTIYIHKHLCQCKCVTVLTQN